MGGAGQGADGLLSVRILGAADGVITSCRGDHPLADHLAWEACRLGEGYVGSDLI